MLRKISPNASMKAAPSSSSAPSLQSPSHTRSAGNMVLLKICFVIGHLEDGRHNEGEGEDEEERHDETKQQCQVVAGEVIWEICIFNLVFVYDKPERIGCYREGVEDVVDLGYL